MDEDLSQIVTTLSERSPQQMLAVITSVGQRIFAEYSEFEGRKDIIDRLCSSRVFKEMHASNEYQEIIVRIFDKILMSSAERSTSYSALERILNEVFDTDSDQSLLYVNIIDNILPKFIKGIEPNKVDCILLPTSTRRRSIGQHAALRLRIASLLTSEVMLRPRAEQLQMARRAAFYFNKNHDKYDEMLGYFYTQGSRMYSDVLAELFRLYLSFGNDEHLEYAINRVTKIADVSKQIRAVHSRSA